jgi:outer membrane receptor protein involved in Fe transport
VRSGVTAQLDGTVIPSVRAKAEATQPDTSKVNATAAFFLGYAFTRDLSLGAEIRYQRYLTTPAAVEKDPSARDNLTAAAGPRFGIQLSDNVWVRPALSYGRGLRGPTEQQGFQMLQLDVPVTF